MKSKLFATLMCGLLLVVSCTKKNEGDSKTYVFDFKEISHNWNVLFSDYPPGEEAFYELTFEHTGLPIPLDNSIKALKVSGNNHSDDLLSVIYKKLDGLKPNTKYAVSFNIEFASNACTHCFGAGGSPNLNLLAGGIGFEPANIIAGLPPFQMYRPNFIKEGQNMSDDVKAIGKIGVGEGLDIPFALSTLSNVTNPIYLSSNANGELWVMAGINSSFEATTTLYYKQIAVTLKR